MVEIDLAKHSKTLTNHSMAQHNNSVIGKGGGIKTQVRLCGPLPLTILSDSVTYLKIFAF